MRWIKHEHGRVLRGEGEPPSGDVFFVDDDGAVALIDGKLYVDGILTKASKREIVLADHILVIETDDRGRVIRLHKTIKPGATLNAGNNRAADS